MVTDVGRLHGEAYMPLVCVRHVTVMHGAYALAT